MKANKILLIEQYEDKLYVAYNTDESPLEKVFFEQSTFNAKITGLKNALNNDDLFLNDTELVERYVFQNTMISYTGFDRMTCIETDNNNAYNISLFNSDTLEAIGKLELAIRNKIETL